MMIYTHKQCLSSNKPLMQTNQICKYYVHATYLSLCVWVCVIVGEKIELNNHFWMEHYRIIANLQTQHNCSDSKNKKKLIRICWWIHLVFFRIQYTFQSSCELLFHKFRIWFLPLCAHRAGMSSRKYCMDFNKQTNKQFQFQQWISNRFDSMNNDKITHSKNFTKPLPRKSINAVAQMMNNQQW